MHYPELAKHLWGTNTKGETWEYMYFLDNLTDISVPIKIFNELMQFNEAFRPYGFASTDSERLDKLEAKFGSIAGFLNYLSEAKWIEKETRYPVEVRENIMKERLSRQIGNTTILEANLENLIVDRVDEIEPGLNLIGRQVDTKEVGRLDLLCEDKDKNLVVVELKRGAAGPSIIEQIQRYMGWAIKHRARPGQSVRGIIIAGSKDTALEYAVSANPLMKVKTFSLSIQE
jgi:hypothetical protein